MAPNGVPNRLDEPAGFGMSFGCRGLFRHLMLQRAGTEFHAAGAGPTFPQIDADPDESQRAASSSSADGDSARLRADRRTVGNCQPCRIAPKRSAKHKAAPAGAETP